MMEEILALEDVPQNTSQPSAEEENPGQQLHRLRSQKGLSVREVAKYCDVSPSTVSRWELGEISNMRRDKIVPLARVLGVELGVIAGSDPKGSADEKLTEALLSACMKLSASQKKAVLEMIRAFTADQKKPE